MSYILHQISRACHDVINQISRSSQGSGDFLNRFFEMRDQLAHKRQYDEELSRAVYDCYDEASIEDPGNDSIVDAFEVYYHTEGWVDESSTFCLLENGDVIAYKYGPQDGEPRANGALPLKILLSTNNRLLFLRPQEHYVGELFEAEKLPQYCQNGFSIHHCVKADTNLYLRYLTANNYQLTDEERKIVDRFFWALGMMFIDEFYSD